MPRETELIRDHAAPKQDLDRVLRDVRDLFRAVLGETSPYAGQAQDLAGRVDCYHRGRDGILAAQQIVHHGLGVAHTVELPEEHPTTETEMKREARAGIRMARAIGERHGIAIDRGRKV